MKKLLATVICLVLVLSTVALFVACSSDDGIVVWVGSESADFYQTKLDEYAQAKQLKQKITVKGIDSSTAAEAVLKDPEAGPAIFTVPHDNLGKLIGTNPVIAALTGEELLAQIANDNPAGYQKVVTNSVNGKQFVFAAPYIGQALVLFYNKDVLSEEDVKTWEGIQAKAATVGADVKSCVTMGNDSYNFSYLMLARQITDKNGVALAQSTTSVKIYDGQTIDDMLTLDACHCTGDDTMAVFKWGQRFYADANGGVLSGSTTFDQLLKDGKVLSLIGGAWKYDSVKVALGSKLGIAQLPSFTITEADAYGTCEAGTQFKSGTFADCKVLCINAQNKYTKDNKVLLEDIIKYMSSKEVQEGSFQQCNNLPAYKNASSEFEAMKADTNEALLAKKQIEMAEWGLPQPFGYHNFLNLFFYQRGADTYTQDIILKRDSNDGNKLAYETDEKLLAGLNIIQNIWISGSAAGK